MRSLQSRLSTEAFTCCDVQQINQRDVNESNAVILSTGDHGGQGGSRAGVQGRKPHHRRQEGQRELGVPWSEASQLAVK